MTLDILIPTYNRSLYLLKNLKQLEGYILKNNLEREVSIIVSNNCSTDNTAQIVDGFISKTSINVSYFEQESNLGLEGNALFVLEKATSPYVMYMGDDDYIEENYLLECIKSIGHDVDISCIIGCYNLINEDGDFVAKGRDVNALSKTWTPGFMSLLSNSHKLHQLSGILLKREPLWYEYKKRGVANIYPFTFLGGYWMLHGKTKQITEYPIRVTQTYKKNWGYGEDGLIQDFIQNYTKLNLKQWQRFLLEIKLMSAQDFRIMLYVSNNFWTFIRRVSFGPNTSVYGKILLPLFIPGYVVIKRLSYYVNRGIRVVFKK